LRISVKRTGGYAGLSETIAEIDTAAVGAAAATRIAGLVEASRFFTLPATLPNQALGADMFRYEITVEDGPRRHTVAFIDDESPAVAPLKRLVESLTA
jgi:hypothetical protein